MAGRGFSNSNAEPARPDNPGYTQDAGAADRHHTTSPLEKFWNLTRSRSLSRPHTACRRQRTPRPVHQPNEMKASALQLLCSRQRRRATAQRSPPPPPPPPPPANDVNLEGSALQFPPVDPGAVGPPPPPLRNQQTDHRFTAAARRSRHQLRSRRHRRRPPQQPQSYRDMCCLPPLFLGAEEDLPIRGARESQRFSGRCKTSTITCVPAPPTIRHLGLIIVLQPRRIGAHTSSGVAATAAEPPPPPQPHQRRHAELNADQRPCPPE